MGPGVNDEECVAQLPPVKDAASLQHLTMRRIAASAQAALWESVGPFLTQLASPQLALLFITAHSRVRASLSNPNGEPQG